MRNSLRNRKANDGFTLIELLIVIAIIGILAAVLIPNLLNARRNSTNTAAEAFGRSAVNWVASAQATNPAVTPAALTGACNSALLQAEGAPAALPTSVTSCTVAPIAGGGFTITSTSSTGTGGNNGSTIGAYSFIY